jgi:hypothetical protein
LVGGLESEKIDWRIQKREEKRDLALECVLSGEELLDLSDVARPVSRQVDSAIRRLTGDPQQTRTGEDVGGALIGVSSNIVGGGSNYNCLSADGD